MTNKIFLKNDCCIRTCYLLCKKTSTSPQCYEGTGYRCFSDLCEFSEFSEFLFHLGKTPLILHKRWISFWWYFQKRSAKSYVRLSPLINEVCCHPLGGILDCSCLIYTNSPHFIQLIMVFKQVILVNFIFHTSNPFYIFQSSDWVSSKNIWVFYFEFKIYIIYLIRWQKNNVILKDFMRFDSWIYWLPVRHANHYTKVSTVSERHRKAYITLQSHLAGSSWIHLIHLIQMI